MGRSIADLGKTSGWFESLLPVEQDEETMQTQITIAALFFCIFVSELKAETETLASGKTSKHSFTFYSGLGSPTPLPEILRARGLELVHNSIVAGAYARRLSDGTGSADSEWEVNLAHHNEVLGRVSIGTAWVMRWKNPPWSSLLNSSLAIGNGVSYALGGIPSLENQLLDKTSAFLYHLLFEVTLAPQSWKQTDIVFRIHHRSGVFGLIDGITGGSDFVCLGLKFRQ
ncbi:MAG: hypothetical protein JNL01_09400 [Bdellovibrionales bacterium]|nr:hypothetical protein [Bdellovibrionales bacterium]